MNALFERPAPPPPTDRRRRGLFVTFEGSEGCGKSTQLARLARRLRDQVGAERVVTVREPGGSTVGEEIRALLKSVPRAGAMFPETELLLFAASRAQLVRETVAPALAADRIVLCDRFADSTTVYQGAARRVDPAAVAAVNAFAVGGRWPDVTVLFDLPVAAVRARLRARGQEAGDGGGGGPATPPGTPAPLVPAPATSAAAPAEAPAADPAGDRLEREPDAFFEAVRAGYRRLAAAQPERFRCVDAAGSPDAVAAAVWDHLHPFLAPWLSPRP